MYEQENESEQEDGMKENIFAAHLLTRPDIDDFIAPDDSEEDVRPKKRKQSSKGASRKPSRETSSHFDTAQDDAPEIPSTHTKQDFDIDLDMDGSTANQWAYDPDNPQLVKVRQPPAASKQTTVKPKKQKAHTTEPEQRYAWLADIRDIDRNPPGHPDFDPRTLYIPPMAWTKFSHSRNSTGRSSRNFWDTIVFFKKGKFYELYEKDATIGSQLFDLKLTDRVNMRMVGVPESSSESLGSSIRSKRIQDCKS